MSSKICQCIRISVCRFLRIINLNKYFFLLLKSYEIQRREADGKRNSQPEVEKRKDDQRRKDIPKRQLPEDGMCHFRSIILNSMNEILKHPFDFRIAL